MRNVRSVTRLLRSSPAFLLAAAFCLACSAPHRVTHEMTWEILAPDANTTDGHVVLRFVKYPDDALHVFSRDLADYLRTLPGPTVPVVFDVWSGCRPAFNEVQIGELKHWEVSRADMYEAPGSDEPSPWGKGSCWLDWWKG